MSKCIPIYGDNFKFSAMQFLFLFYQAGSAWGLFLGPYEAKKKGKGVFDVGYLFTKAEFINDYCHITFWIGNGNNPILFKKKEICGFPTSYPRLRQDDYWSLQDKPAKWDLQKTFCSATQRYPEVNAYYPTLFSHCHNSLSMLLICSKFRAKLTSLMLCPLLLVAYLRPNWPSFFHFVFF